MFRLISVVGVVCAVSTVFFLDDLSDPRLWVLVFSAIVFGYGTAWAGLMRKWGYKPFTNDPIGWRKAKASYKKEADAEGKTDKLAEGDKLKTPASPQHPR